MNDVMTLLGLNKPGCYGKSMRLIRAAFRERKWQYEYGAVCYYWKSYR